MDNLEINTEEGKEEGKDLLAEFREIIVKTELRNSSPDEIRVFVKGWTWGKELKDWAECEFENNSYTCNPQSFSIMNFSSRKKEDAKAKVGIIYHTRTAKGSICVDLKKYYVFINQGASGLKEKLHKVELTFDYTVVSDDLIKSILRNGINLSEDFLSYSTNGTGLPKLPVKFKGICKAIENKIETIVKKLYNDKLGKETSKEEIENTIESEIIQFFEENEENSEICIKTDSVSVNPVLSTDGLNDTDKDYNNTKEKEKKAKNTQKDEEFTIVETIAKGKAKLTETIIDKNIDGVSKVMGAKFDSEADSIKYNGMGGLQILIENPELFKDTRIAKQFLNISSQGYTHRPMSNPNVINNGMKLIEEILTQYPELRGPLYAELQNTTVSSGDTPRQNIMSSPNVEDID